MGKEETKQRILEAAVALFSEKGYSSTTIKDIAEKANINEVTIFRHFGSKENLFREGVILRTTPAAILNDDFEKELTGNLQRDLTLLAERYMENIKSKTDQIWIAMIEARQNPEMARMLWHIPMRLSQHLVQYLYQLHEQKRIPKSNFELLAFLFYGTLFLYVIYASIPSDESYQLDVKELISTSVSLYTAGLTNPINSDEQEEA